MGRFVLVLISLFFQVSVFARTNSYFTVTGDRVMVNIRSGYAFTPDDDAQRLYAGMNVVPENSVMGKGKKISTGESMTLIVADRGKGQFDGTIMIARGQGVEINPIQKTVVVHYSGSEAEALSTQFNGDGGIYEFVSADGRLKIHSEGSEFTLVYSESENETNW